MKRLRKRTGLILLAAVLVFAVASCSEDDDTGTGPAEPEGTGTPTDPTLGQAGHEVLGSGLDTLQITALVVDTEGDPAGGVAVAFTTNAGAITSPVTTDAGGYAVATLTAPPTTTDATLQVCASLASAKTGSAFLQLAPAGLDEEGVDRWVAETRQAAGASAACIAVRVIGMSIVAGVETTSLDADGQAETTVRALVRRTTTGVPLANATVTFSTSSGLVEGNVLTDERGVADATLQAGTTAGTALVVARYGTSLADSVSVVFSPVGLTLVAPGQVYAGHSGSVVAQLRGQNGTPVAGATVRFTASSGTITSPAVTDAQGLAAATYTAGAVGAATITARFAELTPVSAAIQVQALPVAASVALSADPPALEADGVSTSSISAHVTDATGLPVEDGTMVVFEIAGGSGIVQPVAETMDGQATVVFTAGTVAGPVTVTAESGSASGQVVISATAGPPVSVSLEAEAASLPADGTARTVLTARAVDGFGNSVAAGTPVQFQADAGQVTPMSVTLDDGRALASYTAPRTAGEATIVATSGSAVGIMRLRLTSSGPAQVVLVSRERSSVGVRASGDPETAMLIFEVRDASGTPIDSSLAVTVTFAMQGGPGGGESLYPTSDVTDDIGRVSTTLRAGTFAGNVEIRATVGGTSPAVASEPVPVAIHGGCLDALHFSVAAQKLNVFRHVFGRHVPTQSISFDQYSNPVRPGTVSYFSTDYCGIEGSASSDATGNAVVQFKVGNPLPPGPDELATITARGIGCGGEVIYDTTTILLSDYTEIEITPSSFEIDNGGAVEFDIFVGDQWGNPLTGGTTIGVTATVGEVSGDTNLVLPDTQSKGYTFFQVILSDAEVAETDLPESGALTVTVMSENGNKTLSIRGTVD